MKSDITEILLPPGSKMYRTESVTYTFLKALLFCGLIFATSIAVYRYETKFQELESIVDELQNKVTELEEHRKITPVVDDDNHVGHRFKRLAPEYPWVVRTASGDPVLNVQQRRGDDESLSTEEGLLSGRKQKRRGGHGRESSRRRAKTGETITRNHDDETFYTTDVNGNRFYPSGLKEIKDRLPPVSTEYTDTRHAPDLRTRSLPPIRRVGQGNNQVSARVVTFDEPKGLEPVVAHFVADVSNFTAEDNPRLRNTDGIFQIWKPEEWNTKNSVTYDRNGGSATVHKSGIYYIYAQIHYHDANVEGFVMEVNDKPLLQCTSKQEFNSCFTAGLTRLHENDKIVVKNIGANIFSIFKPEKSFFGMMKVAEA